MTLGVGLAALDVTGLDLALPAATPLPAVGLGALGAVVLALAAAKVFALHRLLETPREPAERLFADLADLASIAREQGLLPAAVDPRTRSSPILSAGMHLIIRGSDEMLVRATLESQAEQSTRAVGDARAAAVGVVRALAVALGLAAAAGSVVMAAVADAPWILTAGSAAAVFFSVTGFFATRAVADALITRFLARNASETLATAASVETIMAIRAGEDREQTLRRLAALTPEGPGRPAPELIRRAA